MRLTILLLVFFQTVCHSQTNWSSYAVRTSVTHGNSQELDLKKGEDINYSEIRGNCFMPEEWNPAIIKLKSGKAFMLKKVKLNTYNNSIHFMDGKGTELIAGNPVIEIIFLDKTDTTKIVTILQSFVSPDE